MSRSQNHSGSGQANAMAFSGPASSPDHSAADSSALPRLTLLLAAIASVAVEMLVADPSRSPWSAAGFGLLEAVVAVAVYAGLARWGVFARPMSNVALLVLLPALLAPFAIEPLRREWLNVGRPTEIMLIDAFRLLTLALAALGGWKGCLYPAAAASVFLMLFAAALSENQATGWLLSGFVAVSAWWLAEASWEELARGFHARRQRLPAAAMLVATLVIVAATSLAQTGPQRWAAVLGEWIASSGGTGDHDPYARGGVNDGDQLAAGEDPRSGGGDGDRYLESDEPTLYDAMNDRFGEPFKPKNKQQRAIALSTNNITESHERPARGDSAQREFSIARRSPPRPRPLRDLQAEALFSVQGRTPLHLPLKRYDHFDGLAWRECEALPNRFALKSLGGDWIGLPEPSGPYVAGTITHKIKLGRLRSRRVPLPHDATRFRLGAAGRPDFFYLGASGSLDLADPEGHVPAGEFLHTVETTIDRALCANLGADRKFSTPASNDSAETPSPLFGDYAPRQEVLSLASEWTKAVSPGWRQVEAVVSRLRSQYFHDRESVPPADHPDPLAWFLLESRRGPDYLFAGAAAVVLKAHGWPVRVVSGGYADPTKYDRAANYTHVGSDDLHFWLEVQLPDGLWLPLEPTPGFELAPHVRTWSQWLSDLAGSAVRRLWSNLAILCTGAVLLCGLYAGRRDVTALFALIRWRVLSRRSSANLVDETLRLIETRQWLAEMNRPRGCTPRRFFRERVASVEREETLDPDAVEALLQMFDLHDHATFGSLDGFSRDAIGGVCRRAVAQWPWRKFLPPLVRSTEPVVVKRETADLAV